MNLLLLVLALCQVLTSGDAADPFIGKWVLDVSQSSYPPNTCPARMAIEMEPAGNGVRYRSEAVYKNGYVLRSAYTAEYGGNPVIVTGGKGLMLPVSLRRIDSHTVVATYARGLIVAATSRRVVSSDGSTMTITTSSRQPSGKTLETVGVYKKE